MISRIPQACAGQLLRMTAIELDGLVIEMGSAEEINWANVSLKFGIFSFLAYHLVITVFIIIPATLNISIRLKEVYVACLLKIFQVTQSFGLPVECSRKFIVYVKLQ